MNPSSAFRHILGGVVLVASVWGSGCLPAVAAQEVSVSPPPVAATEIVAETPNDKKITTHPMHTMRYNAKKYQISE